MGKRIDCRGLACPQPVLETKKALEDSEELLVLVDNPSARENVRRFAESQGHQVRITEEKGVFELKIRKQKGEENPASETGIANAIPLPSSSDMVIFIDSDSMGRGSDELGKILMRSFFHTLLESDVLFHKMIFMNSGVKLACQGSEVLDDLQKLAAKNVEILACGTCLEFFGLKKDLRVGRISNMYEISNSLLQAGKMIKV